jgi:hypothetical protein
VRLPGGINALKAAHSPSLEASRTSLMVGPPCDLLAFAGRVRQGQEGTEFGNELRIAGRSQSPEGGNPRSGLARNGWKARRGSRRREGHNPEDATAGDVGLPGTQPDPLRSRPLEGTKPQERGRAEGESTRHGGGLWQYPAGPRKPRDGWRWHSKGCRSAARRGRTARTGSARTKVEAGGW